VGCSRWHHTHHGANCRTAYTWSVSQ
jgi:hypothetical protein